MLTSGRLTLKGDSVFRLSTRKWADRLLWGLVKAEELPSMHLQVVFKDVHHHQTIDFYPMSWIRIQMQTEFSDFP